MNILTQEPTRSHMSFLAFIELFGNERTPPALRASMLHLLKGNSLIEQNFFGESRGWSVDVLLTLAKEAYERNKQRPETNLEESVWQTGLRLALTLAHLDPSPPKETTVTRAVWVKIMEFLSDPWLYQNKKGFGLTDPLSAEIRKALQSAYGRMQISPLVFDEGELKWYQAVVASGNTDLFVGKNVNLSTAVNMLLNWLRVYIKNKKVVTDLGALTVATAISLVQSDFRESQTLEHVRAKTRVETLTHLLVVGNQSEVLQQRLQELV